MDGRESDERVMQRLGRGDDSALAELMDRWRGPVWRFIDRLCRPLRITDDLYQEVWTRVYLYRRRYDPDRPFRPYLFAIAVNCCRRALEGRHWQPAPLGDPPASDPAGAEASPPEALIAAERADRLHQAINRLPEAQRIVVLLHCLMDADYGQIAATLGRSVGTVRSHMHHALRNLRGALAGLAGEAR
jgi:RNA polymerase sigma-70 factor (ECF subfamily)